MLKTGGEADMGDGRRTDHVRGFLARLTPEASLRGTVADMAGGEQLLEDADLGRAVRAAVEGVCVLGLSAAEGVYGVTRQTVRGERSHVSRRTLLGAFQAASGTEPCRLCNGCEEAHPEHQFSRGARWCKSCERKRLKDYAVRKEGEAVAQGRGTGWCNCRTGGGCSAGRRRGNWRGGRRCGGWG